MTLSKPTLLALAASLLAGPALAQITLYERSNLQGRSFSTSETVHDLRDPGFDNRAASVRVTGGRWELCDGADHQGRCVTLRPGRYTALGSLGLDRRLSSLRELSDDRNDARPPQPLPVRDFERRDGERIFQAPVRSVRAVMGPPTQRCWTEQVPARGQRSGANVPAAVAGALLGGILGHQIGGGTGRALATVGGVAAGAALGSRVGGGNDRNSETQAVQRCSTDNRDQRTEYWDVAYRFRGQDHRVQMARPPGASVSVNRDGEPRE